MYDDNIYCVGGILNEVVSTLHPLVFLLSDAVLEEDEVGRDLVRAVALQDDHAFGVHLLAQVEAVGVEAAEDTLGPRLHASLELGGAVRCLLVHSLLQTREQKNVNKI